MSRLGDAPIEVLSLVLNNVYQQSDLYQCALVNKSFYATANPLLWREPQLVASGTKRKVTERKDTICFRLQQSLRQADKHCLHSTPLGHHVRKLNVSYGNCLHDLHTVINNVPLVKELVIDIKQLQDKDIEQIALNCRQLKCLSFNFYYKPRDRYFEPLKHFTNLCELDVLVIDNPEPLLPSLQHCLLEKLKLRVLGFGGVYNNATFFGGIPTLTHLELECPVRDFFQYCQTLPSRTLFPVLTDLRIARRGTSGTYEIDDNDAMVPFFKSHPLIRTLSLGNVKISQAVMTSLATDLIHLQRLSLIKNQLLPPFTKSFHRVEKLTLRGSGMMAQDMAMYFPNLQYIYVDKTLSALQHADDISRMDGPTIESLTKLTYLPSASFTSYDSVPQDLKGHLPRRMGGRLTKKDLDHIRNTALGLVWIDHPLWSL
ncbi:hypothetical protein [Absidia glauca]|uniref:Uncharacterized protein n=1 Tax=Absidia glauca TaxID=4829 RepID=A0A168LY02_ABSGL|nr:hypothetical protein [Absidia glauca]